MSVFVDDMRLSARVGRITARWSHLYVGPFDDLAELHKFAASIGSQRSWFQEKPWPHGHYDEVDTKRKLAIKAGAIPVTWRETGEVMTCARQAWSQVSGGLDVTRTAEGKPPGADAEWAAAAVLFAGMWCPERLVAAGEVADVGP